MKRLLPFVLVILLLLAGILAVPFLMRPESHRQEITDLLTKLFKRRVVIGPISMGYLPPSLKLQQVSVMSDAGTPILQADLAEAPLDWIALFRLQLAPQQINLDHWRLDIHRKPNGHWDIEDYLPGASGLSGAKGWTLREISWHNGEIHWMDHYAGTDQELVLSAVAGRWDPRPETIDAQGAFSGLAAGTGLTISARGQFFTSPQWTGDLQLSDQGNTATFHITKKPDAIDVKGDAARYRLANILVFLKFYGRAAAGAVDTSNTVVMENWQAHAHAQKAHLTFDHSATLSGGVSEAKGSVDETPNAPVLHAELAAKDVPVEALLALAGQKLPLDGRTTFVVKGFEAVLSTSTLSTVAGNASFELKDGHYHLPEASMAKLAKAKTTHYIQMKFPDLAEQGLPITKLTLRATAKHGMVNVGMATMATTNMKGGWIGKVDLAREGLDGYLRLDIHEKNKQLLKLLPLKYHSLPAYGHLQGTLDEWQLRAVTYGRVPPADRSTLNKTLAGK